MIREKYVSIVGGSGGPDGNAIPVFIDHNAPLGGRMVGPDGTQMTLVNSGESGIHYVIVDPGLLTEEENGRDKYMSLKENGQPYYVRIWVLDPTTGHGQDLFVGLQAWVEFSHLQSYELPVTEPTSATRIVLELIEGAWQVTEVS